MTVYFQKHGDEYMVVFYLNPTTSNTSASVLLSYEASFDYSAAAHPGVVPFCSQLHFLTDVCHSFVGGLFGVFLIAVSILAAALLVTSNFRREVAIKAQNAVEGVLRLNLISVHNRRNAHPCSHAAARKAPKEDG